MTAIARLCELQVEAVTLAEDIARLDDSEAARRLTAATRVWGGAITLYIERLKLKGAQVGECPPRDKS